MLRTPKKDTRIIQSLDKGLFLLEVIEEAGRPVSLKDLWLKLKWDKATIHRLLLTLERRGYLLRDSVRKQYTLGLKILGLHDSLIRDFDLHQITRPHLERIASGTGEAAHLAVAVGKEIVFIDRIASPEVLSVSTQIGAREPMHCTALGRAMLAYLAESEQDELLAPPLEKFTIRTVTELPQLRRVLAQARQRGYAVDNEEYIDGIRCVAAAILNDQDYPIAAFGISGPKNRITLAKAREYGELIRAQALEVSRRAGHRPDGVGQRVGGDTRPAGP